MPVIVEHKERALCITFDRPPLNVLDINLLRELDQILTSCVTDTLTDVVILRGAGPRAFSAGVDIREHQGKGSRDARGRSRCCTKNSCSASSHDCCRAWRLSWRRM